MVKATKRNYWREYKRRYTAEIKAGIRTPVRVEKDKIPKRHKIQDFDKWLQDLMRSWSVHELAGSGCGPRGILGNGYH